MRFTLKSTAIALALATTSLVTAGASNADSYYGNDTYRPHRSHANVTVQFGNVSVGYRDGYWDNDHRWHRWNHDRDSRDYRHQGGRYHDWDHDRQ